MAPRFSSLRQSPGRVLGCLGKGVSMYPSEGAQFLWSLCLGLWVGYKESGNNSIINPQIILKHFPVN